MPFFLNNTSLFNKADGSIILWSLLWFMIHRNLSFVCPTVKCWFNILNFFVIINCKNSQRKFLVQSFFSFGLEDSWWIFYMVFQCWRCFIKAVSCWVDFNPFLLWRNKNGNIILLFCNWFHASKHKDISSFLMITHDASLAFLILSNTYIRPVLWRIRRFDLWPNLRLYVKSPEIFIVDLRISPSKNIKKLPIITIAEVSSGIRNLIFRIYDFHRYLILFLNLL